MIAFLLRRLLASVGVLIAVGLIAFAMFRYVGDPVNQMVGIETSAQERAQLRHQLGLDQPAMVQAARFLMNAARFDFGVSYQFKQPVADLIAARMPATLELALVASILALAAGVPMGVYAALRRDSALAKLFQALSLIGISLPTFLIGVLLIYLFAVVLRWLPSFGRGDVVRIGSWWTTGLLTVSGLKSLIMPSITLALFQMTLIMRLVRAEMLEVLRSDYIRFALRPRAFRACRPFPSRAQEYAHSGDHGRRPAARLDRRFLDHHRNGVRVARHGPAFPAIDFQNADVPIMAAYLLMIATLFVVINLIVDLIYVAVDPRLRVHLNRA